MTISDDLSRDIVMSKLRRRAENNLHKQYNTAMGNLLQSQLKVIEAKKDPEIVNSTIKAFEAIYGAFLCEIEHNTELLRKLQQSEAANMGLVDEIKRLEIEIKIAEE